MSKKSDEPLHDIPAFIPIGIASFVQKNEHQWKGNAFVGDSEGEYIDVELSKLPVGASILKTKPSLTGSNEKIILATRSRFKV